MILVKKSKPLTFALLLTTAFLAAGIGLINAASVRAAGPVDNAQLLEAQQFQSNGACTCAPQDTLDCRDFTSAEQAQACFDTCLVNTGYDVYDLDADGNGLACETTAYGINPAVQSPISEEENIAPLAESVPGANNLIANGNFEYGFYPVPQLGFEPPDTGQVPIGWDWYKSNTYGKVTILNNQEFGLVCRDDTGAAQATNQPPDDDSPFGPIPGVVYQRPNNSLSFRFQSTDEPDMRLGVYQIVNVTPGQDYRFSISGTIQVQSGASTLQPTNPEAPEEAQNHTLEISFDQNGGTNWQAVPLEKRHVVEFTEHKLEFKVSEDDEDIAIIQDFETVVRARSDKMTVFMTAWRKWANWRTTRFVIDCVSLVPVSADAVPVQPAAVTQPPAEPAQAEATTPDQTTQIIPPSGGILDRAGNSLLVIGASVLVLLGLVGAGVWNMRR
jgi:hypothetical protein